MKKKFTDIEYRERFRLADSSMCVRLNVGSDCIVTPQGDHGMPVEFNAVIIEGECVGVPVYVEPDSECDIIPEPETRITIEIDKELEVSGVWINNEPKENLTAIEIDSMSQHLTRVRYHDFEMKRAGGIGGIGKTVKRIRKFILCRTGFKRYD